MHKKINLSLMKRKRKHNSHVFNIPINKLKYVRLRISDTLRRTFTLIFLRIVILKDVLYFSWKCENKF